MTSSETSPLALAVIAGDVDRVRVLVTGGADVNQPDRYGWLPIHRAAANNRALVIRYLLAQGSHVEARGTDQWTPLHLACVSGSARSVAALVRGGADVNSVARSNNTPLHLAMIPIVDTKYPDLYRDAIHRARRTLLLLLAAGAKPMIRDARGLTPADVARERNAEELAQLLENATR